MRLACARTADELIALRPVAESLKDENATLMRLLKLERDLRTGTQDLRSLDAAEKQKLRDAIVSAETVIDALRQEVAVLKKNRWGFWKKVQVVTVSLAAGAIAGIVLANE